MNPLAFIATTIALVTLGWGSARLARRCAALWGLGAFGSETVAFALATAGFMAPVAAVGRGFQSFDAGLVAAAAVGGGLLFWSGRISSAEPVAVDPKLRWWVGAAVVGMLVLYAIVAFTYQMHDEHAVYGHKSMVEQFRRNVYPLYYPSLPGEEARYHYGFDILAGALARAYGLHSDHAIDLVCLFMVAFMSWAAAAVAVDMKAERSAPFAAVAIHLGAGLAFVLLAGEEGRHPRCLAQYHHPTCGVELFPTPFLNVFQHPVSVGVPMFLALMILLPRIAGAGGGPKPFSLSWRRLAFVGLGVAAATAVGQFVYYALGLLAALAAWPVWAWDLRKEGRAWTGGAALVLLSVVSLGLAYVMGGMLAPNPSIDPGLVIVRETLGFPPKEPVTGILWHHIVNLGVGFVALPLFAFAALRRRRPAVLMATAFAIGGILVAHLFVYTRSWDIVKFPSAASFALSMLYVGVIDAFLMDRSASIRWFQRSGRVLLLGSGAISAIFVVVPLEGGNQLYDRGRWLGDDLVAKTIEWWHDNDYRSEDVIYAQSNIARELSVFGGLSVVAQDSDLYYMGIKNEVLTRQKRLSDRIRISMDPKALREAQVRWVMFSGEELRNLGPAARKALEDPTRFELKARIGAEPPIRSRRIWRVLDRVP